VTRRTGPDVGTQTAIRSAVAGAAPPGEPFVAVVMSALDEAGSIGAVLAALPEDLVGLRVLPVVVDDGSTDETAAVAAEAGAVVARHPHNRGQGEGLRTGFAVAGALGPEVVVTMDADGQHDPADLPALVSPVVTGEADYVQGSRFLGRYDDAGGAREVGIKGFTRLLNLLAGTTVTDCTNGFRAIRASDLGRMRLVEDRFSAAEIIVEASARGLRMHEVPVHIRRRTTGASRKPAGPGYAWGFLCVIFRSWARTIRHRDAVAPTASVP